MHRTVSDAPDLSNGPARPLDGHSSPDRLIRHKLAHTLDRETFAPAYLSLISEAHRWGGTRIYSERFGVTSPDFAILSTLSNHPGAQAFEIAEIVALDKSVVSRRLQRLTSMTLVGMDPQRRLYLTPEGAEIHDAILPIALEREERLLTGFSPNEIEQLRHFLRRMFDNIPLMNYTSSEDDEEA